MMDDRSVTALLRITTASGWRLLLAAHVLWGAALLSAPRTILGDLPYCRLDRPARAVARVLGARHLAEAVVTGRGRSRGLILAGAAVDAIHAVTFAALASLRPGRRKLALTNVTTASAFALAGVVEYRRVGCDV